MPLTTTLGDALRFESSSVEVRHLEAVGTISGVVIESASASNGPGSGNIKNKGWDGATASLSWRAPGSATFGGDVEVPADGSYLLLDGDDATKFVRAGVSTAFLAVLEDGEEVFLRDVYENAIASIDIAASEASAGAIRVHSVTMRNVGRSVLTDLVVWLDAAVSDLEIAEDAATWVSPTTESAGLAFPNLAVGGTDILSFRRTIGAASPSAAKVLNHIHAAFTGL